VNDHSADSGTDDVGGSLEELYEDAPSGYLTTRPDGTIVRVNATFLGWTGFRRSELVGRRRFQELLTVGGRIYHETHYSPLLRMQGRVREIALDIVCSDGSRLPVLISSTQQLDAAGEPVAVRTVVFNATDRRRYEQELVRARDRERAARERLALLARATKALGQAQEPAARARRLAELLVPDFADWTAIRVGGNDTTPVEHGDQPAGLAEDRVIALPLRGRNGWSGSIELRRADDREAFHVDDQSLAEDLADRTALALDIAVALEHEQAIAHQLQLSLLSGDLPRVRGVRFASGYHAAVESLEVGGDFFDAFSLGPGIVALVVGDVVGRGLQAAVAMGQLRSATRALALAGHSPSMVMESLDRFVEATPGCQFATVVLGELDIAARRLRFACAGHPPPLLLSPAGDASFVWGGRSAPLGANGDNPRPETSVTLPSETAVMLYTDGLIEGRREHPDASLERLRTVSMYEARDVPQDHVTAVMTAMSDGARARDDVCVLWAQLAEPPDEPPTAVS
jgi:PAS domain S-box-containing protein